LLAQLFAAPVAAALAVAVGGLWLSLTPVETLVPLYSLLDFLLIFAGVVVVHELLHASAHPMAGRSPHSILGVWPSRGLFYAHYDGELSRERFIVILLMPFAVITLLPLAAAVVMRDASDAVAFVSAFNAVLGCVDVLGVGLLLWQVPAGATCRNQGWRTYWRTQ
jgi:hypothetical protein